MGKSSMVVPTDLSDNGRIYEEGNKSIFECHCGSVRSLPDTKLRFASALRHVKTCLGTNAGPDCLSPLSVFSFQETKSSDCEYWSNVEVEAPEFSLTFPKLSGRILFCIGFSLGILFSSIQ